jgi:probable DNA metabolism protein
MHSKILVYDGSFDGFLTCVFEIYEYKWKDVSIQHHKQFQEGLFSVSETVITEQQKATRVWKGIKLHSKSAGRQLFYAFLSEAAGVENLLLKYVQDLFRYRDDISNDFSNPVVLNVSKLVKNVGREKHRMEAFVRFQLTKDNIYFANIEPDFNVLPLIAKHFKNRYADQEWIIYDIRRNYGIHYNLKTVQTIELELPKNLKLVDTNTAYFAEEEAAFQQLWKEYFQSTNIKERKNMKLHIQHVPKRYWKYLSEKQL